MTQGCQSISDLRVGNGWSRAQIIAALSGKAVWRDRGGFSLAQFDERFRTEMLRNWNNRIQPGPLDVRDPANNAVFLGEAGPAGSGWTGRYGIKFGAATANALKACLGGVLPNGQTDKSSWAGIPFANQLGSPAELELKDAGAPTRTPKPPNNRSSFGYASDSGMASVSLFVTMLIYGVLDIDTPAWLTVLTQMDRGMFFLSYVHVHGWRDYSKGGLPIGGNDDVDTAYLDTTSTRFRSWTGLYTGTTAADRKGLHRMFGRAINGIN